VVLARLLSSADFGIVAMVTTITGLGIAFADLGLSEATIQREEISHEQISTLFWVNVAIGLALTAITAGLAPELAWLYHEPRLLRLTLFLSLTFLISSLNVQHDALLKREMRFRTVAIRDVAAYAIAVPASIFMAFHGYGYWALAALPLFVNTAKVTISWLATGWIPGLPRRVAKVGSMIGFGGNVAACYFIISVNRSMDNVLIGWYSGAVPLGLYSRAYNLLMLPVRQLSVPAGSVAVPAFSRLQSDPERFARYYLRATALLIWLAGPLFSFLFVAAKPVIIVVLSAKWRDAAPVFQILAISALGQLLLESTVWLLISRGQSDRLLKLLLVVSPIIIASFAAGLPFGIKGVALSGSLCLIVVCPCMLKFAFRGTELTLLRLGRAILCPVSLCFAGILAAELALRLAAPQAPVPQLFVAALAFGVTFALSALIPQVREEVRSFSEVIHHSI
jgi:PST family polysaccharide transporter